MAEHSGALGNWGDLFGALDLVAKEVKQAEQDVVMAQSNAEKAAAKKKLEKKKAEAKKIKERVQKMKRNFQAQQTRKQSAIGAEAKKKLNKMRKAKKEFNQSMARHRRSMARNAARVDPESMMNAMGMPGAESLSASYRPVHHTRHSRKMRFDPLRRFGEEYEEPKRTMKSYSRVSANAAAAAHNDEMLGGRRRRRGSKRRATKRRGSKRSGSKRRAH